MTPGAGDPQRELTGSLARLGLRGVQPTSSTGPPGRATRSGPTSSGFGSGAWRAHRRLQYDPGQNSSPGQRGAHGQPGRLQPVRVRARGGRSSPPGRGGARGLQPARTRPADRPPVIARSPAATAAPQRRSWCAGPSSATSGEPRSGRRERIVGNGRVFDFALTDTDMARLDALGHRRAHLSNAEHIAATCCSTSQPGCETRRRRHGAPPAGQRSARHDVKSAFRRAASPGSPVGVRSSAGRVAFLEVLNVVRSPLRFLLPPIALQFILDCIGRSERRVPQPGRPARRSSGALLRGLRRAFQRQPLMQNLQTNAAGRDITGRRERHGSDQTRRLVHAGHVHRPPVAHRG